MEVAALVIGAILDFGIGIMLFYTQRRQRKADEEAEKRRQANADVALLQMELIDAGNSLSFATAMAVKRGRPNGEMEEAIKTYKDVKRRYYRSINKQYIEHREEE